MKTQKPYYAVIAVFCIACLVIGFASAADATTPAKLTCAKNFSGNANFQNGQPFSAERMISHVGQQGVNATKVKTEFRNRDTGAMKAGLDANRTSHKNYKMTRAEMPKPSERRERLEQRGVDVSKIKAAFQNGDIESMKAWFEARNVSGIGMRHGFPFGNCTAPAGCHR